MVDAFDGDGGIELVKRPQQQQQQLLLALDETQGAVNYVWFSWSTWGYRVDSVDIFVSSCLAPSYGVIVQLTVWTSS